MEIDSNYNLYVYCGSTPPVIDGARVVDITPAEATSEAVGLALSAAALTASDFRARAVFIADADRDVVLMTYAGLCGLAARRVDVLVEGKSIRASKVAESTAALVTDVRPKVIPPLLATGSQALPGVPFVSLLRQPSTGEVSVLRFARRVVLSPASDTYTSLVHLIVVSALRRRGQSDRFPAFLPQGVADVDLAVDLEDIRRQGVEIRKGARPDTSGSLVEALEPTERQARLRDAAALSITTTLTRLGAAAGDDGELWHCPRPTRHTNGDANPSMRVTTTGRTRCYRCDAEQVDSLRLVMDTLTLTADEATDWLFSEASLPGRLVVVG
jgi:hypothetical protein